MAHHELPAQPAFRLREGIHLLLTRWSSLQVAVQYEFGGPRSHELYEQLPNDIFTLLNSWPVYIDEVENMLDDFMLSLNTVLEDGSIEQVSEKLMILHDRCWKGYAPGV